MDTTTSGPVMAANDDMPTQGGDQAWRDILFKTGRVLFIVGLLDIAVMVACIVMGKAYSSSVNVFAVVAGWLLMRGSLKSAGIVRWIAVLSLSAALAATLVMPWITPWDLTRVKIRLMPWWTMLSLTVFTVAGLALLGWVASRLGRPEVLAARESAGLKRRDMRVPAVIGVLFCVVMAGGVAWGLNGESARHAEQVARERFGDTYRYQTTRVAMNHVAGKSTYWATVTVYNDTDMREVPVQWTDPPSDEETPAGR
ncbi:hypothetical protein [Roseateles noduli]|uniref:hypothetical protein n=1 Tax=Roseateles noduli TaxID=2052484 RepID=UPI003D6472DF